MDYSLLVGMHFTDRNENTENAEQKSRPSSSMESKAEIQHTPSNQGTFDFRSSDAFKAHATRRQSHYGLRNQQEVLVSQAPEFYNFLPEISHDFPSASSIKKSKIPVSIFNSDEGGIRGITPAGKQSNVIYYMGIIDILQQYNAKKKLEHSYKSLSLNAVKKISLDFLSFDNFI
jgi:hypothetical protein